MMELEKAVIDIKGHQIKRLKVIFDLFTEATRLSKSSSLLVPSTLPILTEVMAATYLTP